MKLLFSLFCIGLFVFTQTGISRAEMFSDKDKVRERLNNTSVNLIFLKGLNDRGERKFAYAFLQDLKQSESRLKNLEAKFIKFDNPTIQDSPELKQLLFEATNLDNHVSAQREAVEADPKSPGTRTIKVSVKYGDKPAPNWRVGYLGENSIGADEKADILIDQICSKTVSREFYEVSSEAKAEMEITIVVGWVYLWVQHHNKCAPRSEPQHLKNPKVADLYAPSEKP